jgi:hypothetical protein
MTGPPPMAIGGHALLTGCCAATISGGPGGRADVAASYTRTKLMRIIAAAALYFLIVFGVGFLLTLVRVS